MKKFLILLTVFSFFNFSFASEEILKQLEKAWSLYEEGKYVEMKELSEDILSKSLKENYPKGIIEGYYYLGIANYSLGNLAEALKYAKKAIEFSEKHNKYRWKAYSHVLVGEIFRSLRKFDEALFHFKKAYQLAKENNNQKMIPPALMNIGNIYYDKANFIKAKNYYLEALKIAKDINLRKSYIAFITYNLGITSYRSKDYKDAEKYLKDAISLYKELGNKESMYESMFYLGKTYMKEGKKKKAKTVFSQIVKEKPSGFLYKRSKYFLKKLTEK